MKSLIIRIIKQMKNDKRSLALILVAPLLVLSLLYLLLGKSDYKPVIAVQNANPMIQSALGEADATIKDFPKGVDRDTYLKDKKADAILSFDAKGIHIYMYENESMKVGHISETLKSAIAKVFPAANMDMKFVYGGNADNMFDSIGYILLGVLSFFFIFLLSGISFVRERTTLTIERLMMTPIKRWEVMGGYTLGFGFFAALQSILIVLFTKYVLGLDFAGSVFPAMAIMIMMALTAVSLGTFISIFANNEFQMIQFIPVLIVPQIFFSGLIPLDTIPFGLGNLAYIMPVYYGCTGLNNVMIKGYGFGGILYNLGCLAIFLLIFSVLNMLALKRYRKI